MEEAEYRRLFTTRGAHRGQMTKLLKKATDTADALTSQSSMTEKQALEGIVDSIGTKLTHLKQLDHNIITNTTEDKLEQTIVDSDDYIENLNTKIWALKIKVKSIVGINTTTNVNVPPAVSSRKVNLPKLQLPKFDGDPLKWTTFHDAFISSVHEDKNLEEIHKFQYLVGQLTGEAARAIEGLQLTNANYSEALDILQERFGKPHKVIAAYMKAMWELPKPNTTMNSLKEFHDRMESYIRGLHSLGKQKIAMEIC